jgi:hypothetical protein
MRPHRNRRRTAEIMRASGSVFRASVLSLTLLGVMAGAAGCGSKTVKARTDPSPLAIPEPPPRLIEPLPEVVEIPPPEPARPEPAPPAPRINRPPREPGQARTNPDPKPDPAKAPDPLPAVEGPVPSAPRAELRVTESGGELAAERGVKDIIDRAKRTLDKVDYRTLGKDAQEQYNTAKRFADQAEEALKARNPIAAKYLAEKAETIAKELTGR